MPNHPPPIGDWLGRITRDSSSPTSSSLHVSSDSSVILEGIREYREKISTEREIRMKGDNESDEFLEVLL